MRDGVVVKGVQFRNHRVVGDIVELAERYSLEGADELVFYDITASPDGRTVDRSWVNRVAAVINIPFCVAGGIRSVAAAEEVSTSVRSETRFPTALGYALGHAASVLSEGPVCDRQVIDVSGDGRNNEGFTPDLAYEHFPLGGVTVNALAVSGDLTMDEMVGYYSREVIRGPGAFVEAASGYEDFERAMTRKLLREVSAMVVGRLE